MIDNKTVSAIVTAQGGDPTLVGIVLFVLPDDHPSRSLGAYAATFGGQIPPIYQDANFYSSGPIAYGDTLEDAAKTLFTLLQSAVEAAETDATTKVAAFRAAKIAVADAVSKDATAAVALDAPAKLP